MAASTNKVFYMAEMSKIKSTFQKTLWNELLPCKNVP